MGPKKSKTKAVTRSVPEDPPTAPDRLTTLPLELIGLIYDAICSIPTLRNVSYIAFAPHPHQFQPIHSRFLHFQRVSLYRKVVLRNERELSRFANTIKRNQKLGELVESLSVSCEITDLDAIQKDSGKQTMRGMVNSASTHLTNVSNLTLQSTSLVNLFYQSPSHHPLLAQLTHLDLSTRSTADFAKILALSPRLSHLSIDANTAPVSTSLIPPSTQPRTSLTYLNLHADFSDLQIKNLIASSDPAEFYLFGLHLEEGLAAFQDPKVVSRLSLETKEEEEGVESELIATQLARFTRLTHLTLIGPLGLMSWLRQLFSDSLTQLEKLDLRDRFEVDTDLLLECLPFLSKRLKVFDFDNITWNVLDEEPNWTVKCRAKGVEKVLERFKAEGIKVYGMTVDAMRFEQRQRSESDMD